MKKTVRWGRTNPLQSGNIKAIDISSVDYEPEKPFSLLVGTGGTLKIVDITESVEKAIPVQDGYNPIVLSKVIKDEGNTASDLWALF